LIIKKLRWLDPVSAHSYKIAGFNLKVAFISLISPAIFPFLFARPLAEEPKRLDKLFFLFLSKKDKKGPFRGSLI
jgi:hypothetical protein